MSLETSKEGENQEVIEFIYDEDTDQVTAKDLETGIASCGDTKLEALKMLVEALELHHGSGKDIEDPKQYLKEIGVDPNNLDKEKHPHWL